jgi:CRP-like cAMP-binding protein
MLHRSLEPVTLHRGQVLCGINTELKFIYFPTESVVSLVGATADGLGVEIGMVGREGYIGLSLILGRPVRLYQAVVQHEGVALRVPASVLLKAMRDRPTLREELLTYSLIRFAQFAQSAICHRFHTLEQRLCRWLLSLHDRVRSPRLPLTHEFISDLIGGRRPTVGTIANQLEKEGLIAYQRGSLTILNRRGLEQRTCECYHVVRQELRDVLGR